MVCTASDLLGWKDFPKGLKVLLLDNNWNSASDMKSKLEEMDYVVTVFSSEDEALLAISSKTENFHVAIVEVNIDNSDRRLKFLKNAKEIPTIMTSDIHCLTTMMNCIALGAVEFLKKPLSEEKLKNIWQHVVHKAFNAGGNVSPELLKPIKESMVSESDLKKTDAEMDEQISVEPESSSSKSQESENDQLSNSDKFPAPSTPQIKQGGRFLDDGDYHDQPNSSTDKENGEQDGECSKSVDTTCGNSVFEVKSMPPPLPQEPVDGKVNKENHDHHCPNGLEEVDNMSHEPVIKDGSTVIAGATKNPKKETSTPNSGGSTGISNRKKTKVDWTPDLHKKFVQAVEQLGVDQAIPSRILELMKVEGLTRHNVASHLQKYRMQRRHILPKEDQRRWPQPRASSLQRSCYYPPPPLHHHHGPVMAFPPYHSNHTYPAGSVYPMWPGTPTSQPQNVQMWSAPPPRYPWNPMENWVWKPFPAGMHADAWGCPVVSSPQIPPASAIPAEVARGFQSPKSNGIPRNSTECEVADGVIDRIVKEAISKPWLPLPIGLKPPSTDSVLAELSRKGISTVPPPRSYINGVNSPKS